VQKKRTTTKRNKSNISVFIVQMFFYLGTSTDAGPPIPDRRDISKTGILK
jgi:hypothetical protein